MVDNLAYIQDCKGLSIERIKVAIELRMSKDNRAIGVYDDAARVWFSINKRRVNIYLKLTSE